MRILRSHITLIILTCWAIPGLSQTGFELKLEKPKEYEERILRGEKTSDKRIKFCKIPLPDTTIFSMRPTN